MQRALSLALHLSLTIVLLVVPGLGCSLDEGPSGPGGGDDPPIDDPTTGTVRLSWEPPTANSDGSSPVVDLVGYTLLYGSSSNNLSNRIDAGQLTTIDAELPIGSHYVAVVAYDFWQNESDRSNVIQVEVTAPAP